MKLSSFARFLNRKTLGSFLVLLCVCAFLHAAYPLGILRSDTVNYVEQALQMKIVGSSHWDWRFSPLFPLILKIAIATPWPVLFVHLLQFLLFGGAMACVFLTASTLLGSKRQALSLTLMLLFLEVLLLHTTLYAVELLTDEPYATSLLIGSLLAFLGWRYQKRWILLTGLGCIGLCPLLRPVGMIALPLWGIVALALFHTRNTRRLLMMSLLLLGMPLLLWTCRNAYVYGHSKPSAFLGRNVVPRMMPFVHDGDVLFDDLSKNAAFFKTLRTFEATKGTSFNAYAWSGSKENPGPIEFLQGHLSPQETKSDDMFALDRAEKALALRIMRLHPMLYARSIVKAYITLWTPWSIEGGEANIDLLKASEIQWATLYPRNVLLVLYPPSGLPTITSTHSVAERSIIAIEPLRRGLAQIPGWPLALALHLLIILSIGILWRYRRTSVFAPLAYLTVLLGIQTMLHFGLTAAVEIPLSRYQLPGAMAMHIVALLWIWMAIRHFLWKRYTQMRSV